MQSLEEFHSAFAAAMEAESGSRWEQGKIILAAIRFSARHAPDVETARLRRKKLMRTFAQVGKCTYENVRILAETFAAFLEVTPARDRSWTWNRHVLLAARRQNRPLADVLADAIEHEWGLRELRQLSLQNGSPHDAARLDADCGFCKARVHVYLPDGGPFKGIALKCPFCVARAEADGLTVEDTIGRLG